MFGGSIRVARIRGIAVEIHPSWLFVLVLLTWDLADDVLPSWFDDWSTTQYWVVGTIAAVLFFVTVLVHEFAHAIVAVRRGLAVPKITLFIFGGVSQLSRQPATAGEELAIAIAGPLTSVAIAIVMAGLAAAAFQWNEQVAAICTYLAIVNGLVAIFNLVPGFPLDGGRVLRSILWRRKNNFRAATRTAVGIGEVIGYIMIVGGVAALAFGWLSGIWYMLIGWFLIGAGKAESQRMQLDGVLARLRARDVMHTDFVSIVPGLPIQEIVDHHMVGAGERAVMVADERGVLGIVTVRDVQRVARELWGQTPAQRVMTPREQVVTVTTDTPALEVLELLARHRLNQVPVLEDGRMLGMITRRELLDRVHLADVLVPGTPTQPGPPNPSA